MWSRLSRRQNQRLSQIFFRPAAGGLAKSTVAKPQILFWLTANSAAYRLTDEGPIWWRSIRSLAIVDWSILFLLAWVVHFSGYDGRNPSMLLAFLVMVETSVDHCRLFDIITPRYFALSTSFSIWLEMVYVFAENTFRVIHYTWPHTYLHWTACPTCRTTWLNSPDRFAELFGQMAGEWDGRVGSYLPTAEVTLFGRSLIWRRNNNGPTTVPYGTRDSTFVWLEKAPSTTTLCLRFLRNDSIRP